MLDRFKPFLSEEDKKLAREAPEECLRRAYGRGALALDDLGPHLSPRAAEALRIIAGGERLLPDAAGGPAHLGGGDRGEREVERVLQEPLPAGRTPAAFPAWAWAFLDEHPDALGWFGGPFPRQGDPGGAAHLEWLRQFTAAYPGLARLLAEGQLKPAEALETIQAIDGALGRYITGTRYAAP